MTANGIRTTEEFTHKRISWAAIAAGAVVVLVVQLALSLLGLGIGASTIDPLAERNPLDGIGTGSGIWLVVSTLIALFAGGWVAGRVSGLHHKLEGSIHGFLAWGIATLITTYLLASAMGGLLRGAGNLAGDAANMVGRGISAAAPAVGNMVSDQLARNGIDLSSIQAEARTLLRQTGKAELQPGAIERNVDRTGAQIQGDVGQAARNPQNAEAEFTQIWERIVRSGSSTIQAVDKEAMA